MRTIGISGHRGRVGSYLLKTYPNYIGLDCDVTNYQNVEDCISKVDLVLHLAAKSDVEWCERLENQQQVRDVNLRGTLNVCRAASKYNVGVVLLSSDHVFGGSWGKYRENDKPNPKNFYGFSKFAAESLRTVCDNLKIVRTSYLFDRERLYSKVAALWTGTPDLYPTFIIRTFLYLPHFAENLHKYLSEYDTMPRMLHLSGSKNVSWYDFMITLAKKAVLSDYKRLIVPKVQESSELAPRPYNGGLHTGLSKKLKFKQYSYLDGIDQMLKDWK